MDDDDPNWCAVSAGLVVLRLVDSWIADGATKSRVDAWSVSAVREALAKLPDASPSRRMLSAVVDVVVASTSIDMHAICPRLMAYGQALEYEAKLSLAADVYQTIVAHTHPIDDADLVISAHNQLAFCLRGLGDLDGSAIAYDEATRVASAAGDLVGVLRSQVGHAKVAIARGNIPQAESILDETITRANEPALQDVRARALHDRAHVAGLRGQYERSIQFAYQALELSGTQRHRDRILADIAASFMYLGLDDVARDAYLVLAATAQEQYVRWISELNLIEIAAKQGSELQFDRYRRELSSAELSPQFRVIYLIHVGRGYHLLGQPESGIQYLERAVEMAATYKFNQLLFEAEEALSNARLRVLKKATPAVSDVLAPTQSVIDVILDMKQMAHVG